MVEYNSLMGSWNPAASDSGGESWMIDEAVCGNAKRIFYRNEAEVIKAWERF
jgi:hypothetical protein